MTPRLETRSLTKRYGDCVSVSDVSIDLEPGRIHAVLGENGAGKSTLMKLLFGLLTPTSGEIFLNGERVEWRSSMDAIRRGLGMVQQHFTLVDTVSAIDNIMLGAEVCGAGGVIKRDEAIEKLRSLLPSRSLEVPWLRPVSELTVGQKQRVEILKLLFRNSRILFLDEPTAVLTPSEIDDLFSVLKQLKSAGCTIVLITHKINEVLQVCDTYTVLRQSKLIMRGEVKDTTSDAIVEAMIGRQMAEFPSQRKDVLSKTLMSCLDLADEGARLRGVSMQLNGGEIVGVAGVEGSGQTELVESLIGLREFKGQIRLFDQDIISHRASQVALIRAMGMGLVPEDRHHQGLWMDESCHVNMAVGLEDRFIKHEIIDLRRMQSETAAWSKEYDVRASSLHTPARSLSGGNQQKLIFAREVTGRKPRLLICHQPTRGVDLGAIDLIHRRLLELRNDGVGLLILSSELDELFKLCDRIYVFFEGRVTAEFSRAQFDRLKVGAAMTGAQNVS
jgi:ABC-type uncharacterized transport system ATPase subunit